MSYCRNCKKNIAKYECLICNCSYCLRCDSYIHSFPSKRLHRRNYIPITNNNFDEISNINIYNNNTDNLRDFQISQQNHYENHEQIPIKEEKELTQKKIEENQNNNYLLYSQKDREEPIERIIENQNDDLNIPGISNNNDNNNEYDEIIDHDIYLKKISSLGSEIIDTKENFVNRIEALHEHFHIIEENKKTKMAELNNKNIKEIDTITAEKDTQIQQLKEILEEQMGIISQLKEEKINLEKIYDNNKKDIDQLNYDKQKLFEENKKLENTYIQKIKEVMKINEEEKKKLIEEYNEEVIKLKNKYARTEEQFQNTFQEKQKNINDYLEEKNKEKNDLSIMIETLKLENNNKLKEYNKLKYNNEELGKIYNEKEKQYKAMKEVVINKPINSK